MYRESEFKFLKTKDSELDLQVRQYDNDKVVHLGNGGSVVTFPFDELDNVIEFLCSAKDLELKND